MRVSLVALLVSLVGLSACGAWVGAAAARPGAEPCAWTITSVRGAVDVATGPAVRRARAGTYVVPPVTLSTRDGAISLVTAGREATASAGASTSLQLARGACAAGPSMTLASGTVKVATGRTTMTEVRTRAARVQGRGAAWTTTIAARGATVTVSKGSVTVQGATGAPVRVRAGSTTVVSGRAEPSQPTR